MQAYACQALIISCLWFLADYSKKSPEPFTHIATKTAVVGLSSLLIGWGVEKAITSIVGSALIAKVGSGALQFIITSLFVNAIMQR